MKFTVPTVVNGKVYVGTESQLSVYGLLNAATQAAAPAISPASESFTSSVTVTMTDSTAGASIHYTTDGSTPTAASPAYSGPITGTTTETIHAVAIATGFLDSNISTATYTKITQAAMPTFRPAPGTYSSAQQVTISSHHVRRHDLLHDQRLHAHHRKHKGRRARRHQHHNNAQGHRYRSQSREQRRSQRSVHHPNWHDHCRHAKIQSRPGNLHRLSIREHVDHNSGRHDLLHDKRHHPDHLQP